MCVCVCVFVCTAFLVVIVADTPTGLAIIRPSTRVAHVHHYIIRRVSDIEYLMIISFIKFPIYFDQVDTRYTTATITMTWIPPSFVLFIIYNQ